MKQRGREGEREVGKREGKRGRRERGQESVGVLM